MEVYIVIMSVVVCVILFLYLEIQSREELFERRLEFEKSISEMENDQIWKIVVSDILEEKDKVDRHGFVYLIKEVNGDHYKIGRTNNPKDRVRMFKVKLPYQIDLDHLIETDDQYELETGLHDRFRDKRIKGEWFALSTEDVEYIKGL